MNNSYERTKIDAETMQLNHQNKIIQAASRREDRRVNIRNSRQMMQQAVMAKKGSPEQERTPVQLKSSPSMDEHVYVARSTQDVRARRSEGDASRRAARNQSTKKREERKGIRQRAQAQRIYSPSESDTSVMFTEAKNQTQAEKKPVEIRARRSGNVEKKNQPRVVRAHGVSNNPSADARRARLLEQKLRAMTKVK